MNEWLAAAIAVVAGLVIGSVARRVVSNMLSREDRPESLRENASAISGFVFLLMVILGLLVALGIVDPESLEQLPEDLISFVPKALSATILLIGAKIAASFAIVATNSALAGTPVKMQQRVAMAIKYSFLGAAALLAAAQLGVNTTVLNLAVAALFFSVGASFTLLSGLGGRQVSAELAAGRAVRRMIGEGDHITVAGQAGVVARLHPAAVELEHDDGSFSLVPHSLLLDHPVRVQRITSD